MVHNGQRISLRHGFLDVSLALDEGFVNSLDGEVLARIFHSSNHYLRERSASNHVSHSKGMQAELDLQLLHLLFHRVNI